MNENIQLSFSGYHLEKINLERDVVSVPQELSLKITDIASNEDAGVVSLWVKIEIDFDDGNSGDFIYRSIFEVNNIAYPLSKEEFDPNTLDDKQQSLALKMIMTVFPFIRQSLDSITNDSSFNINLPIIDSRDILFGTTLQYVSKEDNDSKQDE